MWAALTFALMLSVVIGVLYFARKRERELIGKLQAMIDRAADGTFDVSTIDESTLSALENSMNRFLKDSDMSFKNVSLQKYQIQTLLSDISHQTVTPISNILLYTQLLEEKDREKIYGEEVSAIEEQTEKLSFLINSLVKLSRLENGIIKVEPKNNKVQKLIDNVMKQVQIKAEEKDIVIHTEPTEETAVFDLKWMAEALFNIVDNAIKYTHQCGKVSITVIPYSFFLRIDIADNGIGIAESEYSKIFGRFYRSQAVSEQEGVGIGLYLAREIVSTQGGYIKVASKAGRGSVFSVFLPMQESIKTVTR